MTDIQHYISFSCTIWRNIYICCEKITISLVNAHHHTQLQKFFFLRTLRSTLLELPNTQYSITNYSHHAIHYTQRFTCFSPILPTPRPWQPISCSLYLWTCFCFSDSTYKRDHIVFVFLCQVIVFKYVKVNSVQCLEPFI